MRSWHTAHRRRARVRSRELKEEIRLYRLEKLKRRVIRELLKRMVKQFEDLIIHGSEFSDATRNLAKAFRGFASGGIVNVPRGAFMSSGRLSGAKPRMIMADELGLRIPTKIRVEPAS